MGFQMSVEYLNIEHLSRGHMENQPSREYSNVIKERCFKCGISMVGVEFLEWTLVNLGARCGVSDTFRTDGDTLIMLVLRAV
jgi:hypothetical protein